MTSDYSIYCDESCHLENDRQPVMVLGAVWCSSAKRHDIYQRIREIKEKHGLPKNFEVKWTKISPAKVSAYLDLVDYFFDDDDIHFRALVVPNKNKLDHKVHEQTHNEWYYKMYFDLLKAIISNDNTYRVFLDIKDTIGGEKVQKLREVLSNNMYDFDQRVVELIQLIRSDEVELVQMTDLLSGAVMATNRQSEIISPAKQQIIDRIKERSRYSLVKSTLLTEQKFNIFVWHGQGQEA
jgi:hypothetical protein